MVIENRCKKCGIPLPLKGMKSGQHRCTGTSLLQPAVRTEVDFKKPTQRRSHTAGLCMNYYQSFSHFADGQWDIEFHCQHVGQHPAFIVRCYYVENHGWILI